MAISFIGSAVGSASPNAGSIVITLPGGMAVNDLIIAVGVVGDTADNGLGAPTQGGYTDVLGASDLYANDINDVNLDLYYKFHNGTDTQATFANVGGTNASNAAIVMVFRGVALVADGGPFDVATVTATGISSSTANPPSINHNNPAGVWTVMAGATGHTGGATATYTAPANYTTNFAQRAHNDTIDVLVGMGYRTNPIDPEDPGVLTPATIGTAADNAWAAVTMALKPLVQAPIDLTTATLNQDGSTVQPALLVTAASAALNQDGQAVQNLLRIASSVASLSFSAKDVTVFAAFVIDLTVAGFTFGAQVVQTAFVAPLATASLKFTALVVEVTGGIAAAAEDVYIWLRRRGRR